MDCIYETWQPPHTFLETTCSWPRSLCKCCDKVSARIGSSHACDRKIHWRGTGIYMSACICLFACSYFLQQKELLYWMV